MEKVTEVKHTENAYGNSNSSEVRARIDQGNCIKLRCFRTTKEIATGMNRELTKWEKIFASYVSDKGLITRIVGHAYNLNYSGGRAQEDCSLNRALDK
jgi:hypothetical protein